MIVAGLVLVGYCLAATALARRLDLRADVVQSSCISGKPSTCVAAWSWVVLPILLALVLSL